MGRPSPWSSGRSSKESSSSPTNSYSYAQEPTTPPSIAHQSLVFFTSGALAGISTSFLSCPLELIRNQRILYDAKVEAYHKQQSAFQQQQQQQQRALSSLASSNGSGGAGGSGKPPSTAHTTTHTTTTPPSTESPPKKKRLSFSPKIQKTSSFEYARVLVKNHGVVHGLYRGFPAHFLRESLGTGIYWLSYESLHRLPIISPTGRREDASGMLLVGRCVCVCVAFLLLG